MAMSKWLKFLFARDKKPHKGLLPLEWVMIIYMIFTLILLFFTYTKVVNPSEILKGRFQILAITLALWGVYRMLPCRFTTLIRVIVQMAFLSWWYPDTYDFNRMFPNLDHLFAGWEQQLWGCQPALLFCEKMPWHWFSELMDLGYYCYFYMIAVVVLFYFFRRNQEFHRASFIVTTAFFIYYVIFILVPVTGPQFYYLAAGVDNIAHGIFPNVHDYFATHQEALTSPGWNQGIFYQLVQGAHDAGERPTAAFPSSHVGISTIVMILAWCTHNRKFFFILMPFYVLLCLSTVYIQAHYVVDVLGGWLSAIILYFSLLMLTKLSFFRV